MIDWAWIERLARLLLSFPLRAYVGATLVPLVWLFVWALMKADRGETSTFKFIHLVTTDTGRGSNKELLFTAAGLVSIWGLWALIVLDKMSEWYLQGVLITFAGSALIAKYTTMKARQSNVTEPPPDAGDDPNSNKPPPALERKVTVHEETTERTAAPVNPLANAGAPIPVEVSNKEPIATTETPKRRAGRK